MGIERVCRAVSAGKVGCCVGAASVLHALRPRDRTGHARTACVPLLGTLGFGVRVWFFQKNLWRDVLRAAAGGVRQAQVQVSFPRAQVQARMRGHAAHLLLMNCCMRSGSCAPRSRRAWMIPEKIFASSLRALPARVSWLQSLRQAAGLAFCDLMHARRP